MTTGTDAHGRSTQVSRRVRGGERDAQRSASQNVASLAQRKTCKKPPRGVMSLDDVRAAIASAAEFDPTAALALRLAAMTGARRAALAALRWTDVDDDGMLTIDSPIEVICHPGEQLELRDAPTKTGNARRLTLDPDTLDAIWALRPDATQSAGVR